MLNVRLKEELNRLLRQGANIQLAEELEPGAAGEIELESRNLRAKFLAPFSLKYVASSTWVVGRPSLAKRIAVEK